MQRRDVLKSALAGAAALAAPRIVRGEAASTITFVPHADLASLDPVWTTADITRNFSLAVYDTLYAFDADFAVQPQMVAGETVSNDGKQWDLTLRDGLKFHDGSPVLARDCAATIKRWGQRDPMGTALMARADEASAPCSRKTRITCRARTASQASTPGPRLSISTGSCGISCPTPAPRRRPCSRARSIGGRTRRSTWCRS